MKSTEADFGNLYDLLEIYNYINESKKGNKWKNQSRKRRNPNVSAKYQNENLNQDRQSAEKPGSI